MSTKIIEIDRWVTASADQRLKYEVNTVDWDRYLKIYEGDVTEAVHALRDTSLLTCLEWVEELREVFQVRDEQITISDEYRDAIAKTTGVRGMIKYVYVVMRDVKYEGSDLVAVYWNNEAAEARARTEDMQALASDISHSVLAVPIEGATPSVGVMSNEQI